MSRSLPPPPRHSRVPRSERPIDPPAPWVLTKALLVGLLVGVVAAVLAALVILVLWGGLLVGVRLGWATDPTIDRVLEAARWIGAVVAVTLAIWAGGYGASAKGSGPRVAIAVALAIPLGVGLAALGAGLWVLAATGAGWALATPARRPRVAAIRAAPAVVIGLLSIPVSVDGIREHLLFGVAGALAAVLLVVVMVAFVEPVLTTRER